jgi:hypothetical protein
MAKPLRMVIAALQALWRVASVSKKANAFQLYS